MSTSTSTRTTSPGTAPRALLRLGPRARTATTLSWLLVALMVAQAGLGLTVAGLYPEQPWAVAALRGNDLVTLLLVVPALAASLLVDRRAPTPTSVVVRLGLLFYGVYNYAYYAFGTHFSAVFLLHVAALAVSTHALVLHATSLEGPAVAAGLHGGRWARAVGALAVLVGLALVLAWGSMSVRFAVTGALPEDVMPPEAVHLVYALDLGVLAPAFLVAGALLWRRAAWGAVLTGAVMVSGAAYLAVLEVVGGFQADAGIAGKTWASPVGIGSTLLLAAAAAVLLRPPRRRRSADA